MHRLLIVISLALASSNAAYTDERVLPGRLLVALETPHHTTLGRFDWQALQSLDWFTELQRTSAEGLRCEVYPVAIPFAAVARAMSRSPIDPDLPLEVWLHLSEPDDRNPLHVWIQTGLPSGVIEAKLEASGLVRREGAVPTYLALPDQDPAFDERVRSAASDQERRALVADREKGCQRIAVLGSGWIVVARTDRDLSGIELDLPLASCDDECVDDLPFPFRNLLADRDRELAMLAVDLPDNDGDETELGDFPEAGIAVRAGDLGALRARAKALRKHDVNSAIQSLGDLALTASEVDGGIAYDLVLERPGGGGQNNSRSFLEMAIRLISLASLHASPELADELISSRVIAHESVVRGEVILSGASLFEAVVTDSDRQRELRQLEQQIQNIERARQRSREQR